MIHMIVRSCRFVMRGLRGGCHGGGWKATAAFSRYIRDLPRWGHAIARRDPNFGLRCGIVRRRSQASATGFSVLFPYVAEYHLRPETKLLISLARPRGIEPLFSP